ncbi:MAG: hypothetical protein CSA58_08975 [Micrococcales bacterium]|nr:MAG: hypothetical protein CSA58_08975 [Micrococcales bacterium]
MVAVWGPVGAPGRSTVAVHLASVLAAGGQDTLLVDADSYGASVAHLLGILDDAPGLAAACRSSVGGQLRADVLARIAVTAADRLRVLTGIPDAARWPEITAAGLSSLWPAARALSAWTVVDTAAVIEEDEELSYDTRAPRRNMAALSALRAADEVVVVGRADPLGLARLIRGLDQLRTAVPGCAPVVVLTGARRSALGPGFTRSARALLGTHAAVHEPVVIPDDRQALDAALLAGRPAGSKSATVQAMTELLARITADSGPAAAPAARRRIVARR